jgi:hypothetical protein
VRAGVRVEVVDRFFLLRSSFSVGMEEAMEGRVRCEMRMKQPLAMDGCF